MSTIDTFSLIDKIRVRWDMSPSHTKEDVLCNVMLYSTPVSKSDLLTLHVTINI